MILVKITGPEMPRNQLIAKYIQRAYGHNAECHTSPDNKAVILYFYRGSKLSTELTDFATYNEYFEKPEKATGHFLLQQRIGMNHVDPVILALQNILDENYSVDYPMPAEIEQYLIFCIGYLLSGLNFNGATPNIMLLFPTRTEEQAHNPNYCLIVPKVIGVEPMPWDIVYTQIIDFMLQHSIIYSEVIRPGSSLRHFKICDIEHLARIIIALSNPNILTPTMPTQPQVQLWPRPISPLDKEDRPRRQQRPNPFPG